MTAAAPFPGVPLWRAGVAEGPGFRLANGGQLRRCQYAAYRHRRLPGIKRNVADQQSSGRADQVQRRPGEEPDDPQGPGDDDCIGQQRRAGYGSPGAPAKARRLRQHQGLQRPRSDPRRQPYRQAQYDIVHEFAPSPLNFRRAKKALASWSAPLGCPGGHGDNILLASQPEHDVRHRLSSHHTACQEVSRR